MSNAFSPILRFMLQEVGANSNTWGANLNTAVTQLIEDSIAGRVSISMSAGDVTTSQQNGLTDQSRYAIIALTGSGPDRTLTVPALSKIFIIENNYSNPVTVKPASGSGVVVLAGTSRLLMCNGTNVVQVVAEQSTAYSQNVQSGSYTLIMSDAGKDIIHPSGAGPGHNFAIPSNASVPYPVGTILNFTNLDSNNLTIAINSDSLILMGTTVTGSRTLLQNGTLFAKKMTATTWLCAMAGGI